MHVCMYVYICMHACMHTYIHTYIPYICQRAPTYGDTSDKLGVRFI